jgi:polyferredoxin
VIFFSAGVSTFSVHVLRTNHKFLFFMLYKKIFFFGSLLVLSSHSLKLTGSRLLLSVYGIKQSNAWCALRMGIAITSTLTRYMAERCFLPSSE